MPNKLDVIYIKQTQSDVSSDETAVKTVVVKFLQDESVYMWVTVHTVPVNKL